MISKRAANESKRGGVLLVASVLGFLFIGFIKGAFSSPVDLTIVMALITVIAAATHARDAGNMITPLTILLFILIAWLAIRATPNPNQWALRKLGDVVALGAPAFLAGFIIARDESMMDKLLRFLALAGVPSAIFVVWQASVGNPYSFSSIGSGGYQLTGMFLAFSFIAAAALRWHVLFATAALGCAVTGNVSGAAFGAVAVIAVWIIRKDWRSAGACIGLAFTLIAVYTIAVAPPLVFMRLLWKFGGSLLFLWDMPVTPFEATEALSKHSAGRGLNAILSIMPEESKRYLVEYPDRSRLSQYMMAFDLFRASPIIGNGFGSINYLGSPYPHNVVLELAAETGVVGVLLFIAVTVTAFRSATNNTFALAAMILVFLVAMVSGYFGGRIFMFCLGLAGGARHAGIR